MTRRLLIAWPGIPAAQQAVWSMLSLSPLGDRIDFCQQLDAYDGRIPTRAGIDRSVKRDWHPDEPTHCYWDYEPGDWVWDSWNDEYDDADVRLVSDARAEVRAWREETGRECKAAIYGIPVVTRKNPRGFRITDHSKYVAAKRVIDGWDWVFLNLYPPHEGDLSGWMEDREAHAMRASTTYSVSVETYGLPVIPFLHLRGGMDCAAYAEVYGEALARAGADTLGLWMDLRSEAHARRAVAVLSHMLPGIRRFLGVG